jgi:tetratricopeptide (TPR) repeat protein
VLIIKKVFFVAMLVTVAAAQTMEPPLSDSRLTIHTLVREDIFAGFLADDMPRFSRGEKTLELLLEKRPDEKSSLLAWKGGAALYRAVRANEANRKEEFERYYKEALALFTKAGESEPHDGGAVAVTGGSFAVLGDRLPQQYRAAAWDQAYQSYQWLWKQQEPIVEKLPLHIRGELLGGLAQSAQRTGRTEEMNQYLDKIMVVMRDTPYESVAKKWKANPAVAASVNVTCLSCHEGGRLAARIDSLNKK